MEYVPEATYARNLHRQRYESNDPFTSSITQRIRHSQVAPRIQNIDDIPLPSSYPDILSGHDAYYDGTRPLFQQAPLDTPYFPYSYNYSDEIVDPTSYDRFPSRRRRNTGYTHSHFRTSRSSSSRSSSRSPHRPQHLHRRPTDTPRPPSPTPVLVFPAPVPDPGSRRPPVPSSKSSAYSPMGVPYAHSWYQPTPRPTAHAPHSHAYPHVGPNTSIASDNALDPQIIHMPDLSSSESESYRTGDDAPLGTYLRFLINTLPRDIYLLFLLRLPTFYWSRVDRIFKDADLTLSQIKEMALQQTAETKGRFRSNLLNTGVYYHTPDISSMPPAYRALKVGWESFIDTLMKEWETQNIVSVLLLAAIMTVFQIHGAGEDPITRYLAFWSLICALVSLLYGCLFIIRFGTMRKPYKAAEWALEARNSQTVLWNGWVMLAMPAIWLTWSILTFIGCIMSFMWRAQANLPDDFVFQIAPSAELGFRIYICAVLGIGVGYGILILDTFRRYGTKMDEAWRRRVETFMDVYPQHQHQYQHRHHYAQSPTIPWSGRSGSQSTMTSPMKPYRVPSYHPQPYPIYRHSRRSRERLPRFRSPTPPDVRQGRDVSHTEAPYLKSPNPSISPRTQGPSDNRAHSRAHGDASEERGRRRSTSRPTSRHRQKNRPPSNQARVTSKIPTGPVLPRSEFPKEAETHGRPILPTSRKQGSRQASPEPHPRPTRRVTIQDETTTITAETLTEPSHRDIRDTAPVNVPRDRDRHTRRGRG